MVMVVRFQGDSKENSKYWNIWNDVHSQMYILGARPADQRSVACAGRVFNKDSWKRIFVRIRPLMIEI